MPNSNIADKKKVVEEFLVKDKFWSAEILSCLDENIFPHLDGFFNVRDQLILELALVIKSMQTIPVFIKGSNDFCLQFLQDYIGVLQNIHVECTSDVKSCFDKYFDWRRSFDMQIMSFDCRNLRKQLSVAEELSVRDVPEMTSLLRDYIAEDEIDIDNLRNGIYFGVKKDGKLVSMAGTHNTAFVYGIATVGNVVTHKDYCKQGYAQESLKAVIGKLSEDCDDVIIKVERTNKPALALYEKLGFVHYKNYFEGFGLRRT